MWLNLRIDIDNHTKWSYKHLATGFHEHNEFCIAMDRSLGASYMLNQAFMSSHIPSFLYVSCRQKYPTATQITEIINLSLSVTSQKPSRVYLVQSNKKFLIYSDPIIFSVYCRVIKTKRTRKYNKTPTFQ